MGWKWMVKIESIKDIKVEIFRGIKKKGNLGLR